MFFNEEILNIFQQIVKDKQEISLMNVYKGVPITYQATIYEVIDWSVIVITEQDQIVCLDREKETYIRSNYFKEILRARVMEVDFTKTAGVLSRFEYIGSSIGKRTQVRVEPKDPISGFIEPIFTGNPIKGELADLSEDGLGIYLPTGKILPGIFVQGTIVNVYMQLPRAELKGVSDLKVEGKIVNTQLQSYYERHRIGVRLQPDTRARKLIKEFISQRHFDIMKEIKAVYELLNPPG
jgi:hypothetical protein